MPPLSPKPTREFQSKTLVVLLSFKNQPELAQGCLSCKRWHVFSSTEIYNEISPHQRTLMAISVGSTFDGSRQTT